MLSEYRWAWRQVKTLVEEFKTNVSVHMTADSFCTKRGSRRLSRQRLLPFCERPKLTILVADPPVSDAWPELGCADSRSSRRLKSCGSTYTVFCKTCSWQTSLFEIETTEVFTSKATQSLRNGSHGIQLLVSSHFHILSSMDDEQ